MKFLQATLTYLFAVLKILAFGWLLALWRIIRELLDRFARGSRQRGLTERERRAARARCVPIAEPAYHRPDPLIYSQTYLMARGLAVTWDNPDVELRKNGVPVPSSDLEKDTEYELIARVWNSSTEAPVIDLPVRFSYLSFGVGTQSHPIGDAIVPKLGVKGGPNHPAFAAVKWRTPREEGHYCIQVLLDWLDDEHPDNNLGQENTQVGRLHSPAEFTFDLRNATLEPQVFRFETDAYQIPPPPPCSERPRGEVETRPPAVPPRHDRRNYPVPAGWSISIDPGEPRLDPGEERSVRVTVTAPAGFRGRQTINVHAFHRYGLAGGVTLYVDAA